MKTSFGSILETQGTSRKRVLLVGQVAGAQAGDGWFSAKEIERLFEAFRVEAPKNLSRELSLLRNEHLVLPGQPASRWSLTPRGAQAVDEMVRRVDSDAIAGEMVHVPGAELGHARHTVLPPTMAPSKWVRSIGQMLEAFDFDSNVFCMTRFPDDLRDLKSGAYLDPVADVIPVAIEALAAHRLKLHLASDRQLDDDLFGNIAAHMWACRYGIALFEDRRKRGLNENMLIEVGSMLITGRRCALLKDKSIKKMPTDFVGQIYKPVDFLDLDAMRQVLHHWAAHDLGLGPCASCPDAPEPSSGTVVSA
jgi:hypothetical protein